MINLADIFRLDKSVWLGMPHLTQAKESRPKILLETISKEVSLLSLPYARAEKVGVCTDLSIGLL